VFAQVCRGGAALDVGLELQDVVSCAVVKQQAAQKFGV